MDPQPTEAAPVPETQPPKPRRRTWMYWALALLLVVYPLSSGPVIKLWTLIGLPPDPMLGLYTPLIYLAFYSDGFRRLFAWYLKVWKAELPT